MSGGSTAARRRERERTWRLETILGAAEAHFADEGYHGSAMERIAEDAEVSVGTIYFYFKNKEALLIELLDTIGFELRELLGGEFRGASDAEEGLQRASRAFFEEFCARRPSHLAIIFRESVGQSAEVEAHRRRIFEKLIDDLKAALERMVAAHEAASTPSPRSLDIMAAAILGTYERLAYRYFIWNDEASEAAAVADEAAAFIIGGIDRLLR